MHLIKKDVFHSCFYDDVIKAKISANLTHINLSKSLKNLILKVYDQVTIDDYSYILFVKLLII